MKSKQTEKILIVLTLVFHKYERKPDQRKYVVLIELLVGTTHIYIK